MKGALSLIDRIEQMKESMFFFFLFLVSLMFRLPTLFNDYYDVDELAAIVQTKEFFAGFRPGIDFAESKLPLYHAIFKFSYYLNAAYTGSTSAIYVLIKHNALMLHCFFISTFC